MSSDLVIVTLGIIGAFVVVPAVALLMWRKTRRERQHLIEVTRSVSTALGLELAEPGERLDGERGGVRIQVIWHRWRYGSQGQGATVAKALIDPPLVAHIVLSTPYRAAGPRQRRLASWGEPAVYLGGRGADEVARAIEALRPELHAAALPPASAGATFSPAMRIEIDRGSVQLRLPGYVSDPQLLDEVLGRAATLARACARVVAG